ncbi:MAG: helix-turn-helix transcriptional regulator [Oscillospiraceae bacterium]|nr:helix-turn-helix transcriptional regulator [Oscillospiraceae bacterium]
MKETLGERIRRLRIEKNWKQDLVAKRLNVNVNAISRYESDLREPSLDLLYRIADLFHVSTDYLLGKTDQRTLDTSELTDEEAALIQEIIDLLNSYKRFQQ